jgi:hypothetical protein
MHLRDEVSALNLPFIMASHPTKADAKRRGIPRRTPRLRDALSEQLLYLNVYNILKKGSDCKYYLPSASNMAKNTLPESIFADFYDKILCF